MKKICTNIKSLSKTFDEIQKGLITDRDCYNLIAIFTTLYFNSSNNDQENVIIKSGNDQFSIELYHFKHEISKIFDLNNKHTIYYHKDNHCHAYYFFDNDYTVHFQFNDLTYFIDNLINKLINAFRLLYDKRQ